MCKQCYYVDNNLDRIKTAHICEICKKSAGAQLFLPIHIATTIDLALHAYHSTYVRSSDYTPTPNNIGSLIYFCTLRELLINKFLEDHLFAKNVPLKLIEKLFNDNKLANQKFNELFHSVTDIKWNKAIGCASQHSNTNFQELSHFMKQATEYRNAFLHKGDSWKIPLDFANNCINSIPKLIHLFVTLHNIYTYPILSSKTK